MTAASRTMAGNPTGGRRADGEQPLRGGGGTTRDRLGDIVVAIPAVGHSSSRRTDRSPGPQGEPMTAQPTTRITTPPFAPQGPHHGQPQPQPFGPVHPQSFGPAYPPPFPPAPPAAPRRRTGKIVGLVAVALVLLAGLGVGALFLFGQRTVEPESVQREIVRITQTAVGVVPADVRCPTDIKAEAGGTFACTATVDGQPVGYTVRQDDDKGHLTITYDRLIKVTQLESTLADQVGK